MWCRTAKAATSTREELLLLFGAQAATVPANARLAQRLEASAVLEERQRFAMDLHDGIIQDLYAIGLGCIFAISRLKSSKIRHYSPSLRTTTATACTRCERYACGHSMSSWLQESPASLER